MMTPKAIFRALRYRNFRLFFIGQGTSLIGTWMQTMAMAWLVYRLTNSAWLLGMVGFVSQIPTFFLTPFAGVFADRWDRRRTLILTQTLAMVQAFILAILTLNGHIAVWHIVVMGIILGCINSLDMPMRQAFVVEMVDDKEILHNAIALNSFLFNAARLIGPSVAGIIVALAGEGICFLLNGISYLAVIISLYYMVIKKQTKPPSETNVLRELKDGIKYALNSIPIKNILMLISSMSVMGMSYAILMPIFARDVLHGGAQTLGFLMATSGIGALAGTIYLASRRTTSGLGDVIMFASFIFGIGLVAFSLSHALWLSLIILVFIGFGMMVQMAAVNTVLQTIVHDDKRGRIMSLYTTAFAGVAPLGSLLAGALAGKIGAPATLIIGGIFCLCVTVFFSTKIQSINKLL
jgi:MFS family permease